MSLDLVLRNAILTTGAQPVDIGVKAGRIVAIDREILTDAPELPVGERLVFPGFVDSHLHLDKSCIMSRCCCCLGTLAEAIDEVAKAKADFSEEDVYKRGEATLLKAIRHGTNRIRTHVEVDPRIGLTGFRAIRKLKKDYASLIDLQICAFPQEGLLNDPGAEDVLMQACRQGADLVGGCPYTDNNPAGHVQAIFRIAKRFDMDIDFHLDFDLDSSWMHLDHVCANTILNGWGGRVTVGHVTKLSAVDPLRLEVLGARMADLGIAVTVLPATDLFLMGRDRTFDVPRGIAPALRLQAMGVTCSVATNNVLNPFTPFGDCSLIRMANLYANVAAASTDADMQGCFGMVSGNPAAIMGLDPSYGVEVGKPAHLVVLNCSSPVQAVREIVQPLMGLRYGILSFTRPAATVHRAASQDFSFLKRTFEKLVAVS